MSDHLHKKIENVKEEGNHKFKEAAAHLASKVGEFGSTTKDLAADSFESARKEASEIYAKGAKNAAALESRLEESVRANPMKALLIAAGVGAAIVGVGGLFNMFGRNRKS